MPEPRYILLKNLLSVAKEHHDATDEDAAILIVVEFRPKWIWKLLSKTLRLQYRIMAYVGKVDKGIFTQKASYTNTSTWEGKDKETEKV